jgi:hypothetical protein
VPVAEPETDLRTMRAVSVVPVLLKVVSTVVKARVEVWTVRTPDPETRSTPPVRRDVVAFRMFAESSPVTTAEARFARPVVTRVAAWRFPEPVAFVKVRFVEETVWETRVVRLRVVPVLVVKFRVGNVP